ncbi:uncharacterized protein PODANS_5_10860 [Podospora anserina S mat+]|uniref:Alpha subunit of G protein n=1 Tax=Podospora anserina (strain S / ATCC MYA-4624 / DSM 980 / FGSC 10383) TaxID=515849 RepID=B2APG2_PODAN|nr:uncharacterized protein PODANS_5_10860 [Podospora anserina S mat+]CAP65879.1 unnamed protein product [Podospora anserina S mat+]CDP30259.1 Putative alpha subunit of G protein [Podospora anserina S mat+]
MKSIPRSTTTTAKTDILIADNSGLSDEEDHLTMSATPTTKVFWQLTHANAPSSGVVSKRAKRKRARSTGCFGIPFDLLAFLRSMSVFPLDPKQNNNTKRIQSSSPHFESEKVGEVKKSSTWPLLNSAKAQAAHEARLATKRSAAIDRQLELDREAWCRKAQVMVTSCGPINCEGKTLFFDQMRRSSSPGSYENHEPFTNQPTENPAGQVIDATIKEMQRILQEIHMQATHHYKTSDIEMEEPLTTLLSTAKTLYETDLHTLGQLPQVNPRSLALINQITKLWSDPAWTKLCYTTLGRSKPFTSLVLSLLTRSFSPSYTPTSTDLSHIKHFSSAPRTLHREALTPFPATSSLEFDLIDRDNTSCCSFLRRKIFNFLSPNLSVIMLVDLASYSQALWEDSSTNQLRESLLAFEGLLNDRRYAQQARGAMMLLLWNSEGLEAQLGERPLGRYMKEFKGRRGEESAWCKKI